MEKQNQLIADEISNLKIEMKDFSDKEMPDARMQKELKFRVASTPSQKTPDLIPLSVKVKIKKKLEDFRKIAMKQDEIIQGQVQLLNFEFLKDHLGPKWNKFRILIYKKTDSTLESVLSEGDVFLRTSDCFYLIAFEERDLKKAKKKLVRVRDDVLKFYFGTDVAKNLEARKKLTISSSGKKVDSDSFLKDLNMITNAFGDKEVAIEAGQNSHDKLSFWEDRLKYQPFWDAKSGIIVGYQVYLKEVDVGSPCRYTQSLNDTQKCTQDRQKTDIENLKALIEVITELHGNKFIFMSLCPLSFTTIRNRDIFRQYMDLCKGQPSEVQKLLNIELVECPTGSPSLKLKEAVQLLSPYVRNVILNINLDHLQHYDTIKRDDIKIVSIDLAVLKEVRNMKVFSRLIKGVCKKLSKEGLEIYLNGVNDPEVAMVARSNGVRYISGSLIGLAREFPEHMTHFSLPFLK